MSVLYTKDFQPYANLTYLLLMHHTHTDMCTRIAMRRVACISQSVLIACQQCYNRCPLLFHV